MAEPKLTDILDYFEDIARSNVDIAHTDNARHFCGSWDEFIQKVKTIRDVVMIVEEVDGSGAGNNSDNNQRIRHFFVWILKPNGKKTFTAEYTAQAQCEAIHDQVRAKMKKDREDGSEILRHFNPNDFRYDRINSLGGVIDNWVGYLYYYDIQSNVNLTYNPAKWQ